MINENKKRLIGVYNEVLKNIQDGGYTWNGEFIGFDILSLRDIEERTRMYTSTWEIPQNKRPVFNDMKVYVENIDTFQKAISMGPECVVLNMASRSNPGGGVASGSRAQEEELCRRSNLLYSLYSFVPELGKIFDFIQPRRRYPIPISGGIYSPSITIYREPGTYKTIEELQLCSVISVPGINRPRLDPKTGMLQGNDISVLKDKVRTILRIAILEGHNKIVLGALGCGAYQNPPKHVARIFRDVLGEAEFCKSFKEVCFAILEDSNSLRNGGNFKPFFDVFGGK